MSIIMSIENFSYDKFCSYFPVSRETHKKLESYVALIEKWQRSVNLVSNSTLPNIWLRHVVDCFQLSVLVDKSDCVMDLGSGAGLPGIILAITGFSVTMVESDTKKVAFLREAARVLGLNTAIHNQRVEGVNIDNVQVITARAFASVSMILMLLESKLTSSHKILLLKGKNYIDELMEAEAHHTFDVKTFPSVSDPSGVILLLYNINQRGVKPL